MSVDFPAPGIGGVGAQLVGLEHEVAALAAAVGPQRAVVGIDAVEVPGVCEVNDDDIDARVATLRRDGVGMSPCWELLLIGKDRVERVAEAWRSQA